MCGVQFFFQEAAAAGLHDFPNLQDAWHFWRESDGAATDTHPFGHLGTGAQDTLRYFLGGLRRTAEFTNIHTQPGLRQRVQALGGLLQDPQLAADAVAHLRIAMESCGDRLIQGLDDLELLTTTQQMEAGTGPRGRNESFCYEPP